MFTCLNDRVGVGGGCEVSVTATTRLLLVRFRECGMLLCGKRFFSAERSCKQLLCKEQFCMEVLFCVLREIKWDFL